MRYHALMLTVYDLAVTLAVWCLLVPSTMLRRGFGLAERLGKAPELEPRRRIVVHAVSVGEMAAAAALVEALAEQDDGLSVLLTTGNREGRAAGERLAERQPAVERVDYLPWDRRRALRRWLGTVQPAALVVVETEIWPALYSVAGELDLPLLVVNGRIYRQDRWRYQLARSFFASVLANVRWFGVLDSDERTAFEDLGVPPERIHVTGNLKLDTTRDHSELPTAWHSRLDGPLIVAGSTHAPEERTLLDVLGRLRRDVPGVRLVLAPRHPRRSVRLQRQIRRLGWTVQRLSEEPVPGWQVLITDQIGSLPALYEHADVALIGGSFVRRGGHNPIEAARLGVPVVIGPHHWSFTDMVTGLSTAGGAQVLRSGKLEDELVGELHSLLTDASRRELMAAAGRAFCAAHRGAAHRTAEAVLEVVR